MRRALSIFLVLLFGLGPLAATVDASDDARLPACCRRHGAHHCSMSDIATAQSLPAGAPILTAPSHCPSYPRDTTAIVAPVHALASSPANLPVLLTRAHSAVARRVAARSSQFRAHAGRSPPLPLLG